MMPKILLILFFLFTHPLSLFAETPAGKPVSYPQRIVSLGPTITEVIYLLEAESRLIANTVYCVRPPDAKHKEKIGTVIQANIERIVGLRPDLVLAISLTRPRQLNKLEKLGIRVIRFGSPKSFSEICRQVLRLGEILGKRKKAKEIIARVQKGVAVIREKTKDLPKKRVFVQIGTRPLHTATKDSFVNDYIEFSGGINIAYHERSGIYSREKVLKGNPEVILIATMGIVGEKERDAWRKYRTIAAVRHDNIHIVDPEKMCSPTPVTFLEVLRDIEKIIHPDSNSSAISNNFSKLKGRGDLFSEAAKPSPIPWTAVWP